MKSKVDPSKLQGGSGEKKKESQKEAKPAPAPKAQAAAPAAGGAVDEAAIKAVGDEIRVLKEKLKGEGLSGKKVNEHEEVKKLVTKLQELKAQAAAAPAAPAAAEAKPASPKQKAKKEEK